MHRSARHPRTGYSLAGAHPVAPLLRHASEHGFHIALPRGMDKEERDADIYYDTRLQHQVGTVYSRGVGREGAGRAHGTIPF